MSSDRGDSYGDEARARISALGRNELAAFISEIPRTPMKGVLRRLPEIAGFRPDSAAGINEQKRRLIRRLCDENGKGGTERDWHILEHLWLLWAHERLDGSPIVPAAKAYLRSREQNSDMALEKLLQVCISESEGERVSKEALEEFFNFAPFAETSDTANVINAAIRQSALADKQVIATLRNTVDGLALQVKELAGLLEDSCVRSDSIEMSQANFAKAAADLRREFEASQHPAPDVDAVRLSVDAHMTDLNAIIDGLRNHIARIEKTFAERLNAIESAEHSSRDSRLSATPDITATYLRTSYIPPLPMKRATSQVNDGAGFLEALRTNLLIVGVDSPSIERIGATMLSALCSGQFTSFKGSFASLILAACASLIANTSLVIDVELGRHDNSEVRRYVEAEHDPFLNLVFLHADRGAFDLYADVLIDSVVMRQAHLPTRARIVGCATLTSAPSSIPISSAMAAIGPIIDTDGINWRRSKRNGATLIGSELGVAPWDLQRWGKAVPEFVTPVIALLGKEPRSFRGAVELSIRNAGEIFDSLIKSNDLSAAEAEIALLSYWCIPYLTSCGVPIDQIRKSISFSELAEHLAHATVSGLLK